MTKATFLSVTLAKGKTFTTKLQGNKVSLCECIETANGIEYKEVSSMMIEACNIQPAAFWRHTEHFRLSNGQTAIGNDYPKLKSKKAQFRRLQEMADALLRESI